MELTVRSVVLGSIVGLVFGAANAYLALKVGMTISASIPAAVVSMAILRGVMRRGTVLENNMVQTIGSCGESLAAGVVFTIPAFFILGLPISMGTVALIALLGGCLGVLMMIPFRRPLIVDEHLTLSYPEGTACAKVLVAGDKGGRLGFMVFLGAGVGALYRLLISGFKIGKEALHWGVSGLKGASIGADLAPALLAVGYLIGPRVAAVMFAGGILGSLVFSPLIAYIGEGLPGLLPPGGELISEMSPGAIRGSYVRYLGAGAVACGGLISLMGVLPTLLAFFGRRPSRGDSAEGNDGGGLDLPKPFVVWGGIAIILLIWWLPVFNLSLVGAAMVVIASFLFVGVSSRIVGLIGSSANPVSGMTIATLIVTSLVLLNIGFSGREGMWAALTVGALVCVAICMAGDISQDLKTGYLVGASPSRQQIGELIGVVLPAMVMGWVVLALHRAYGIGSEQLPAPQASLMAAIVEGIMEGTMPWGLILMGIALALVVQLCGVPALPFAIGLYLPLSLTLPIMIGGGLAWWVVRRTGSKAKEEDTGMLYGSGLIAGDALAGLGLAPLFAIPALAAWRGGFHEGWLLGSWGSALVFVGLAASLVWFALDRD